MSRVYISGPMTGYPEHNFPMFYAAAWRLRSNGYTPLNPADNWNGVTDLPRAKYIRKDLLTILLKAQQVAALPGWQWSAGARLEIETALQTGLPVWEMQTGKKITRVPGGFHRCLLRLRASILRPAP